MPLEEGRFHDRSQAGRDLAEKLTRLTLDRPIVYALPRGGVPVAAECAKALDAPLDLVLVRKIGAPGQPELGIGALAEAGEKEVVVINQRVADLTGASAAYIDQVKKSERDELARRGRVYFQGRVRTDPAGRDAVLVDDGLATGSTAQAAVRSLKARGAAKVVLAIPVAPPDTLEKLEAEADTVVCLLAPRYFNSVGQWYADFHQLEDEEVVRLLDEAARRTGSNDA